MVTQQENEGEREHQRTVFEKTILMETVVTKFISVSKTKLEQPAWWKWKMHAFGSHVYQTNIRDNLKRVLVSARCRGVASIFARWKAFMVERRDSDTKDRTDDRLIKTMFQKC